MIKFVAACLNIEQENICKKYNIEVIKNYVDSYGEIKQNCITDFFVHCFNSEALKVLASLGVTRATLHPELNLAQIRDIRKPIETEIIIYGKLPLMTLRTPRENGNLIDRRGMNFFIHNSIIYNSVPIFIADKLNEIEKCGISHGRLIFTTETKEETENIIKAYLHKKPLNIKFTRGKFYSRV